MLLRSLESTLNLLTYHSIYCSVLSCIICLLLAWNSWAHLCFHWFVSDISWECTTDLYLISDSLTKYQIKTTFFFIIIRVNYCGERKRMDRWSVVCIVMLLMVTYFCLCDISFISILFPLSFIFIQFSLIWLTGLELSNPSFFLKPNYVK